MVNFQESGLAPCVIVGGAGVGGDMLALFFPGSL